MILGIASTPPFCDARLCQKPTWDLASEGRGAARMILRERLSPQGLQRLLTLALNTLSDPFPEEGGAWEMEMNAQATKLQAVETI
jgi:hypothetical protein